MGWGKSFKKAWKKTVRAVTKPVEKAANSFTKAIMRGSESVIQRTGMEGTFVGDWINSAVRNSTLPVSWVGGQAAIVGGESVKDTAKGLMTEVVRSMIAGTGERKYRKLEKAARQNAEAAAYQRRVDEEVALAQAMAKKKAMIGKQESEKARPITDSYLSAGGTLGGYVDAEELKKKKKLGGGK